jgi:hypothetical protein
LRIAIEKAQNGFDFNENIEGDVIDSDENDSDGSNHDYLCVSIFYKMNLKG